MTVPTSQPTTARHAASQPSTPSIQLIPCFHPLQDDISEYTHHENVKQAEEVRQALAQPASPSAPAACPEA